MACSRARRLPPMLALLVVAACVALGSPQALGGAGGPATSAAESLRATTAAVEAVLPVKLEQGGERAGGPAGTKHRLPPGLAVVAVALPGLAVALRASRRPRLAALQPPWFTTPPSRGPPLPSLVAT